MTTFRLVLAGVLTCLSIYLFVSAPTPLPDGQVNTASDRMVEVERVFQSVNAINDAARQIYTGRIVGGGLKAGLKFGEDWAEPGVDKGPLPALFLRLAAGRLEAKPVRLGLYLGSDAPINKSNLFGADQMLAFEELKSTQGPVFSEIEQTGNVGMFPDFASAQPCVTCHNEHPDSPKTDWQLHDIMGATTWTYPRSSLGAGEYLNTTEQFFEAVREAYGQYLAKAETFETPVPIGTEWPSEGNRTLPDIPTFMAAVREAASVTVVEELILISSVEETE